MNLWECHISQIPTGPFCQWRTAGHRLVAVMFPAGHPWPSFNSLGPPRWDKGARMQSLGQILVVCTLGRETVMESCSYLYRLYKPMSPEGSVCWLSQLQSLSGSPESPGLPTGVPRVALAAPCCDGANPVMVTYTTRSQRELESCVLSLCVRVKNRGI